MNATTVYPTSSNPFGNKERKTVWKFDRDYSTIGHTRHEAPRTSRLYGVPNTQHITPDKVPLVYITMFEVVCTFSLTFSKTRGGAALGSEP